MTVLALNVFKGMWPRSSLQQLPPEGAELAVNCDLLSGDLKAIRSINFLKALTSESTIRSAFRIPASFRHDLTGQPPASQYDDDDVWFFSECSCTNFLKGPLVNDSFSRYYWTQRYPYEIRPSFAALEDLIDGGPNQGADPYYIIGVPAPATYPTVSPSGGTAELAETRCYVYTFVNIYGEESAPSPPTCAEGNADGTWALSNMDTAFISPWSTDGAPLDKIRVYRTITGETGGSFFFVDEIDPPASTYNDVLPTDEVSLNAQLESSSWAPPPDNLIGIVRHPDGFLVGFEDGGDLRFSVPYRPHAWPAEYALSTEGDIQALGVFGQSVAVLTNAHPYVVTGTHPASVTLTKSDTSAPCLSLHSVVSFEDGVVYCSPDGLTMMGYNGVQVLTEGLVSVGEWYTRYDPSYIHGAKHGYRYLGISIHTDETYPRQGLQFAPREPSSIWTEVSFLLQQQFENLQTDLFTGDVLTIINNSVYSVDTPVAVPENYQWKSMEFVTPKPINFGVFRIDFDPVVEYPNESPEADQLEEYTAYNAARIQYPLNTLNQYPINGVRQYTLSPPSTIIQNRQPLGGSPLYSLVYLTTAVITMRLYGNRQLRHSVDLVVPGIYRLPIGYKADIWQIEFLGNADIHHFKLAETGKELARV